MNDRILGVCYYPEHWDESEWPAQARQMREHGISMVRIAEFAWSRIEPSEGKYDWDWLDRAVDVLADAGLSIVMGTPTACPPQWLVGRYPDVLPVGPDGRSRGFGSRRHYSFSSDRYRGLAADISGKMAARYGKHPAIVGWQIDNEYGCHDTTLCYSDNALQAFRDWLSERYSSIDALNDAWGNVFWSQEYRRFEDVGLPVAVTECNPAHRLAFRRFSSDQVVRFNEAMLASMRAQCSGEAWFTHNFMGNFTDFDHFDVMAGLDIASWDSYPLGFLDISWMPEADKATFRRTGHPDWASFHHSLYRATGRGRFGVMEQQPGPVNWASNNAEPHAGMVRLWTWEAFAAGAEFVSIFRWRQAPFAQEQMHAGIQRWDGTEAQAGIEIRQVADELNQLMEAEKQPAPVALVFDYASVWSVEIQPNQAAQHALRVALNYYSALRSLGIDVDVVGVDAELSEYSVVLLPAVCIANATLEERLARTDALRVYGPRYCSRTDEHRQMQPALPFDLKVRTIDGVRPGVSVAVADAPSNWFAENWIESLDTDATPQYTLVDGRGLVYRNTTTTYINAELSPSLLRHTLAEVARSAGLTVDRLPEGLRMTRLGDFRMAFNYGPLPAELPSQDLVFGDNPLPVGGVAAWR